MTTIQKSRIPLVFIATLVALTGCASGDGNLTPAPTDAPGDATVTPQATGTPASSGDIVVGDVCDLFDGINVDALINTPAGEFTSRERECSVAAADPLLFAQASITLGSAPAIVVMRGSYEGPVYDCPVVDLDGLGDQAFTCIGGSATSHVVFTAGDHLVVFSAGNNVEGPPSEQGFLEAAQQIHANMTR